MSHAFEESDIVYGKAGGTELFGRLYKPLAGGPFPAVVEVHGGAWTANDRFTNVDIHRVLAEAGVVVLAIDFRMPPECQYPEPMADINLAVRWLKREAAHLGSAPERVGLVGTSSGGHQAMLSMLKPDDHRYMDHELPGGEGIDASVAYIAVCWPIVDPLARYRMVQASGNERLVNAHHAYWPDEAAMAEGNPQLILERGEGVRPLPPALVLQGTSDGNVTPTMATDFRDAYRAAGGDLRLEVFEDAPHAFIGLDPTSDDSVKALSLIREFVAPR